MKQEKYEEAAQTLDILSELANANGKGKSPDHVFLEAMLEWRLRGKKPEAIRLLD